MPTERQVSDQLADGLDGRNPGQTLNPYYEASLERIEREIARLLSVRWSLSLQSGRSQPDRKHAGATPALPAPSIRFGHYEVYPGSRLVLRDGQPVNMGSRAFDILIALLRSPGTIMSKDEIVKFVWPSTHVDESNLRFQMSELRKALAEDRDVIKTIPGRGYILLVK